MHILITGSSGFLGSHVVPYLESLGHHVSVLKGTEIRTIAAPKLEGFDAVIHLAGENIGKKRWSKKFKKELYASRVDTTNYLVGKLLSLKNPPKCFIGASATGYYGDTKEQIVNESSPPGSSFLATLCKNWEDAAKPLQTLNTRVVHLRFGVILSNKGGALPKMLKPFKLGIGGKLGNGLQYMSWIALEDVLGIINHVLNTPSIQGPVNATSPLAVTNEEFTKTVGTLLHKPTLFSMPAPLVRLLFGQMGDELFLSSTRVNPKVLLDTDYAFKKPILINALI